MKVIERTGTSGTNERGVVTVDWVVLGTALFGLAIALLTSLHWNEAKMARAVADTAGPSTGTLP